MSMVGMLAFVFTGRRVAVVVLLRCVIARVRLRMMTVVLIGRRVTG